MPGLKRHAALQDLSRDHQRFLLFAREMRWCLESDPRARPPRQLIRDFLSFWEGDGTLHLKEEEEVLLPAIAGRLSPDEDEALARMLADHAWLHQAVAELQLQVEMREDCLALVGDVSQRLHDHVRLEERVIFEQVQIVLGEAELARLGEDSRAFRLHWRGPLAVGPAGRVCHDSSVLPAPGSPGIP